MYTLKSIVLLVTVIIIVVSAPTPDYRYGPLIQMEGSELENAAVRLKEALAKVAAGDGPKFSVVKVTEANRLEVDGTLYRYTAVLQHDDLEKDCEAGFWYRPHFEFMRVWIKCAGMVHPFIETIPT